MYVRIEALSANCQTPSLAGTLCSASFLDDFSASLRDRAASFLWHGNSLFGETHGQTGTAAGDGAVGRFLLQAARGKFSGGIF